jgi:hypothetical protein
VFKFFKVFDIIKIEDYFRWNRLENIKKEIVENKISIVINISLWVKWVIICKYNDNNIGYILRILKRIKKNIYGVLLNSIEFRAFYLI